MVFTKFVHSLHHVKSFIIGTYMYTEMLNTISLGNHLIFSSQFVHYWSLDGT